MQSLQQQVGLQQGARPLRGAAGNRRLLVVAAAPATKGSKGFGAKGFGVKSVVPTNPKEFCTCGAKKFYKDCCKPYHKMEVAAPTPEGTVAARFSAYVRNEQRYLLNTFHPEYDVFHYQAEDTDAGHLEAQEKLKKDVAEACTGFRFTGFKIHEILPGDSPEEAKVKFQYTSQPVGQPTRKIAVESSTFKRGADNLWRFASYNLREVPEGLLEQKEADAKALREQGVQAAASGEVAEV